MLSWLRAVITGTKAAAEATEHDDGPYTLSWTRGGRRHLTFDNHRSEDYEAVFCGNWDRILIARDSVRGGPLATHITLNDPASVIARCEADLAILDLYEKTAAIARGPDSLAQGRAAREARARDCLDAQRELCALAEVIRLLAAGYRHQPGFREEWAP